MKTSEMTNQEDRLMENLTIMTLTFAEVDALRDRMKIKEEEISSVRKSLVMFAGSREDASRQSGTPRQTLVSIEQQAETNRSIALES